MAYNINESTFQSSVGSKFRRLRRSLEDTDAGRTFCSPVYARVQRRELDAANDEHCMFRLTVSL